MEHSILRNSTRAQHVLHRIVPIDPVAVPSTWDRLRVFVCGFHVCPKPLRTETNKQNDKNVPGLRNAEMTPLLPPPPRTCVLPVCRAAMSVLSTGVGVRRKFLFGERADGNSDFPLSLLSFPLLLPSSFFLRQGTLRQPRRTHAPHIDQTEQTGTPHTTTAQDARDGVSGRAGRGGGGGWGGVPHVAGAEGSHRRRTAAAVRRGVRRVCRRTWFGRRQGRRFTGDVCLDVSANTRGLSVLALREAGREVSEAGLLKAAADGDVSQCTLYLDAGVPVDCRDGIGMTPLHHSCRYGHLETARLLLDRGSTAIDEKNCEGETPLHHSCIDGHLETASLLLDRGSTAIAEKDGYGCTPLHVSCGRGHLEIARLLLDRGSTAIDEKGSAGSRPLVPALSPMGWRAVLRSGRVHKPWPRLRSSGSRHARHRSHIRQLRRARTIRHGSGRASGRANWYGGGSGRPRPTGRAHTRPRRVRGYR